MLGILHKFPAEVVIPLHKLQPVQIQVPVGQQVLVVAHLIAHRCLSTTSTLMISLAKLKTSEFILKIVLDVSWFF